MGLLSLEPISGWGRHPVSRAAIERPETLRLPEGGDAVLPRGLGRSYGDAAIPATPGARVIETTRADRVLDFDAVVGTLTCEAGLSLAELGVAAGVSKSCVWRWETQRRRPRGEAAVRYLRVLEDLSR